MMKKRVREGSALFLALLLVCSIITLQRVDAANAVDTTARCSVEFTLAGGTYEELNSIDIPVRLYRVASIDESGKYTALAGFESVDVSSLESDTASADAWLARAAAAADLITDATPAAARRCARPPWRWATPPVKPRSQLKIKIFIIIMDLIFQEL